MSLLPPDVHAELAQLLQAVQSSDNSIRSQAEEHLQNNWTNTRPEVLLMGLAEQIQAAGETAVRFPPSARPCCALADCFLCLQTRSFAAVIFRRIASKTRRNEKGENLEMFIALPADQAAVIRQKLLETLGTESDRAVRNKISDAVAELARQYSDNSPYPDRNPSWQRI